MTKTFCDKCGKEITQYQKASTLTYKLNQSFCSSVVVDMCEDCWDKFLDWMENEK